MNFFTRQYLLIFCLGAVLLVNNTLAGLMGNEPVNREQISELMNDAEFQKAMSAMGVPIDKMTPEEKEQLVNESVQQIQQIQQMSPEEQERLMHDAFSQMQQMQEAPQKQQAQPATPPQQTLEPVKSEPKKPQVSQHSVKTSKNVVQRLAKHIERAEIKFDGLLTASPDNSLEIAWAQTEHELIWVLSALHRITNNDKVLEKIASTEYSVLKKQLESLTKELKSLNKKFKVPDTAQLKHVEGIDASRAGLISDTEKERSKKAAETIIKVLGESTPAITYGIKGMLEKYDKETLDAVEKEAKERTARPKKPEVAYHTPKAAPSERSQRSGSYYDSPYDYPSYYGSSSPYYGSDRSSYGPSYDSSYPESKQKDSDKKTPEEKTKETKDGAIDKIKDTKTTPDKEQKKSAQEKGEEKFGEFTKQLDELEKKSEAFNKKYKKVVESITSEDTLKKLDENPEATSEIAEQLEDIRAAIVHTQSLASAIKREMKHSRQETAARDTEKKIWQQVENLKQTKALVDLDKNLSDKYKTGTLAALKSCATEYLTLVKNTKTAAAFRTEIVQLKQKFISAGSDSEKEKILKEIISNAEELKHRDKHESLDIDQDKAIPTYGPALEAYIKTKTDTEQKSFKETAEQLRKVV